MTDRRLPHLNRRQKLGLGGAVLLALGVAGGAGAVSLTRPSVTMAPTIATPAARLSTSRGVVSVRGRVAEVYGDRFVIQDGTGRALVDVGRGATADLRTGTPVTVQGRYDNGQLRAQYLVDAAGTVEQVGPGRHGPHGPPPPPGAPGAGPPPPPPGGPGTPPPPPPPGAETPPPPAGAAPPPAGPNGPRPGQVLPANAAIPAAPRR